MKNTILIVPGYGDSGPEHWQTYWERQFPNSMGRGEAAFNEISHRLLVQPMA